MRIHFTLPRVTFTVALEDNASARDLLAMLPLTLELRDFHGIEKIAHLPERLTTEGAPAGASARAGDLTLYAPWGNLAFFYRPFEYAAGLVPLGRIEGDPAVLESIRDGDTANVTLDE